MQEQLCDNAVLFLVQYLNCLILIELQDSSQRRKSVIEANSRQMEEKLKKTAIVKPMAAKSKMKNQVKPEAEKPLETTVKFKSPTRNYNKKNKVKRRLKLSITLYELYF